MSQKQLHTGDKTMDETKQTFIEKLKNYQTLSNFEKSGFEGIKFKNDLMRSSSPRFAFQGNRKITQDKMSSRGIQELREKLYGRNESANNSLEYLKTRFQKQQQLTKQEYQKNVFDLQALEKRYEECKVTDQEKVKRNFLQLDEMERRLMFSKKQFNTNESGVAIQRGKSLFEEVLSREINKVKSLSIVHRQTSHKYLSSLMEQQNQLQQSFSKQSIQSEHLWCQQLDSINESLLSLNNLLTQTRLEQDQRFSQLQWRVKQIQFNCAQVIQQQRKDRSSKDQKLYGIIRKLIDRIGGVE